ncbi:hypothetical protein [Streptomyces sp. ECR3]|uniref:hypothetical protein n=1 Tax=Streptomyces sp. ECR3 TaxID=3400630 RepID=UPI003F19A2EC
MLSHALERGVLVLTVHRDPGPTGRAALAAEIGNLVHAYRPRPVVVVLEEPAAGPATVGAVLRAHRLCSGLGVLMSASAHSAPARRLLEEGADTGGCRLVVHARRDTAIAAAFAAA